MLHQLQELEQLAISGSQEHLEQTFQMYQFQLPRRVYTETSAINTTTFYRRKRLSTFGGKHVKNYSNVIEIKVGTPPISTLQVQGTAISAPATLTLCAGEDVTFVATGGTERFFILFG